MTKEQVLPDEVALREVCVDDLPFIYNSWINSYWDGYIYPVFGSILSKDKACRAQHDVIETLLKHTKVIVAHRPSEPEVIFGWLAYEPDKCVHYVYVKYSLSGHGLATLLLDAAGVAVPYMTYTHVTKSGRDIMQRHKESHYDPWMLLNKMFGIGFNMMLDLTKDGPCPRESTTGVAS